MLSHSDRDRLPPSLPQIRSPDSTSSTQAEVSIARSISVSRRQRQLLVPMVPKTVRQPQQPTLVDVKKGEGHKARNSHHVLLEMA